jgi:hypothetical protein
MKSATARLVCAAAPRGEAGDPARDMGAIGFVLCTEGSSERGFFVDENE